ncbi:ferredoxin reductase family protein [Rathayibacter sp. YIM 133350]|uniref:ferredoxin reductase family protein n=1 Tax=Rathayibacter sp. YIM 133350 TaxID=3131992 RepID=UPI00307D0D8A
MLISPTDRRAALLAPATAARKRRRRVDVLQVLAILSVAVVVALFLADRGLEIASPAEGLDQLGILCGLVGTDLLLLMLLLAARLPIIDRAFGHDRAMVLHAKLGKPALLLLIAHAGLLLVGYAITDGADLVAESFALSAVPDMPLAFLGLAALIAVVVTSLVIVRRRLRFEVWHLVHLLAYAGALAAVPHQFSVGGLFAEGTLQRWYWIVLYVAVALSLLLFRFALPVYRSLRHGLRVSAVRVTHGVADIRMRGRALAALRARGGQFLVWRFWTAGLWWQAHPYSLSSIGTHEVRISVRALGTGSAALAALRPGTRVSVEGPYGIFTEHARTRESVLYLAAGIGTAPLRALIEEAVFVPWKAAFIIRAGSLEQVYLLDEITELCRRKGITLYLDLGHRDAGSASWLSGASVAAGYDLRSYAPWVGDADVFVCGPRRWTDAIVHEASAIGLKSEQVHYERFDW